LIIVLVYRMVYFVRKLTSKLKKYLDFGVNIWECIIVKMKLYFQDKTTQTIEQPLVYENKKWLIGLSFERQ
jgi:hypothetical protein